MEAVQQFVRERKPLVLALGGVLALCLVVWSFRLFAGGEELVTSEGLREELTVVFEDTGEKVSMARGDVLRQLLERPGSDPLPVSERIANPKTGKATGRVGSESAWAKFIEAVNEERSFKGRPVGGR